MTQTHKQDWGNYWQGRAAQDTGEALVGVGIEDNAKLSEFWVNFFTDLPKTLRIADFACGAGSALKHAHAVGHTNLTGVDIAEDAIAVLKQAIPGVQGCVSPVSKTPFDEGEFDVIVSQFGFEYAGETVNVLATAKEIIRLLGAQGKFTAIAHIKGGAIEQESLRSLASIRMVLGSHFTQRAQKMFETVYLAETSPTADHQKAFMQSLVEMSQAEGQIIAWLKSPEARGNEFGKFGHYLVTSTREMFERRQALELKDCLQWLEDMHHEILAYQGRMGSMTAAALSQETVNKFMQEFGAANFEVESPAPFYFNPSEPPVAWVLSAQRNR